MLEDQHIPTAELIVRARFQEVFAHLRRLPRDATSYGLVHFDAHTGNMFVDTDGRITLFDFDDCAYSWYANDVAIVLFYAVCSAADPVAFTRRFLPRFLASYRRELDLDPAWLREIPWFLKLREIDLYAVIHRSFDVDRLGPDSWDGRYMAGRRQRIEHGVPYLDLDFEALGR